MTSQNTFEPLVLHDFLVISSGFHDFYLPKTKIVDFNQTFKGYLENEETLAFITSLSNSRATMAKELQNYSATYEQKLIAVDAYFPLVFKLLESLANQPPVAIDRPIYFEWKGAATTVDPFSSYTDFVYEVSMVLHTKAILHYLIASQHAKDVSGVNTAGQHLMTAASIMEYMAATLLPKWHETYHSMKTSRPPEVNEQFCYGMAAMCKSAAARMTLIKAFVKEGGTSMSTLAKLAHAVQVDAKHAFDIMKNEGCCFGPHAKIHPETLVHLRFQHDLANAMIYAFHGKSFMDKNELGNAIGCYDYAILILSEQNNRKYDILAPGVPHSTAGLLPKLVQNVKKMIESQKAAAKRDNDFIYFQEVPRINALPDIPPPIFVLKMSEFDPYAIAGREIHIFIHDPPKKGILSSLMSSMRGSPKESDTAGAKESLSSSASAPPEPQADTRQRSDSEVAREFQRRINAGENL